MWVYKVSKMTLYKPIFFVLKIDIVVPHNTTQQTDMDGQLIVYMVLSIGIMSLILLLLRFYKMWTRRTGAQGVQTPFLTTTFQTV